MSNSKILISKIFSKIEKDPCDIVAYQDLFELCRNMEQEDFSLAHDTNAKLRSKVTAVSNLDNVKQAFSNVPNELSTSVQMKGTQEAVKAVDDVYNTINRVMR